MNTFPLSRPLTLDEFVKGYADGGEVGVSSPFDFDNYIPGGSDKPLMQKLYEQGLVSEDEYNSWLAETMGAVLADRPVTEEYNEPTALPTRRDDSVDNLAQKYNLFVEGADVPQSTGVNVGALDELFANLRKTEQLQKLALEPGLLQQGFTGTSGLTAPPSGASIYATPTRAEQPAIDFNVTPEMAAALQQVARPAEITSAERAAVQENPRVQALQQISDQLQSNDFKGAFDTALKAEQQLGGDFVGNIVDPNKMRMLRDPMNAQEIAQFYTQMPEKVFEERYLGPGNEFKKEQAIERNVAALGGQEGYVDPMLGAKKEETLLSKLPIKELTALAAAAMGATAIPGLFGGASSAGGAGGAGALTGVTPTGLVPGTTAAKLAAASAGAAGGVAAAPLAEVVITASKFGLTIPQAAALVSATGAGALSGGAGAPATAATTPTQPPLEEIVVTGKRAIDPALLRLVPGSLASANLIQGMTDIPTDIYGQVEGQPDLTEGKIEATEAQQPQEPFKDRLDEVIVTGSKYKPGLLDLAKIGTGGLTAAEILKGFTEPTLRPYEKVTPEGEAPPEEVVVTGTRLPPIDLMKIGLGGLTAAQLTQGFTQPKVDPLTGEPTEPPKTEQELDKIQDALKTGAPIPGTSNRFLDLLKKYGTIENILKVAGAVSGLGGTKAPPTGGGAGAVYDPRTSAGAGAWIDWEKVKAEADAAGMNLNTYTARNWNKIQNRALEAGVPQAVAPEASQGYNFPGSDLTVNPQGTPVNFDLLKYLEDYQPEPKAYGGMAKGSKVRGPGHGREDLIPALLSDGEYVIDAETMALLGNGSTDAGAKMMDGFRENIRKHKGAKLAKGGISPDAKSPLQYLRGA